jgi:hypothetical protein
MRATVSDSMPMDICGGEGSRPRPALTTRPTAPAATFSSDSMDCTCLRSTEMMKRACSVSWWSHRGGPMGCRICGVIAGSHGRRNVHLVEAPCFDRPVRLIWRKRTWRCVERSCPISVFTEQTDHVSGPRALLTRRACWWAINRIRQEPPAWPAWRGSSVRPGTRCGRRFGRCWRRWLGTRPGSPASPGSGSMSTYGTTFPSARSATVVVDPSS